MSYNGHKNKNHWNVSLWLNNDRCLYDLMRECVGRSSSREVAAATLLGLLKDNGVTHTPDGKPYSKSAIRAAMVGLPRA